MLTGVPKATVQASMYHTRRNRSHRQINGRPRRDILPAAFYRRQWPDRLDPEHTARSRTAKQRDPNDFTAAAIQMTAEVT